MTPELLKQYLDVLRGAGLMSAHLEVGDTKLNVVFAPEVPMGSIGGLDSPAPGGWKGPERLDDLSQFEPEPEAIL